MTVKEQVVHSDPEITAGSSCSSDEFLQQFPSVNREQALATLELAKEPVVGVVSPR